eukprot:m.7415 g.7415  ORF g.7415 m.7415 type:complete len:85 (-) comp5244_c0_seq2:164-418(-)
MPRLRHNESDRHAFQSSWWRLLYVHAFQLALTTCSYTGPEVVAAGSYDDNTNWCDYEHDYEYKNEPYASDSHDKGGAKGLALEA